MTHAFRPLVRRLTQAVCCLLPLVAMPSRADDLLEIFNLATERDPVIREARARYNASETIIAQGRAAMLPTVNVTGQTSRDTSGPASGDITGAGGNITRETHLDLGFNSQAYGVSLRQALLNVQAWYLFQSARNSERQAAVNLASNEQQLILRVAQAYFNVLRSQDNLDAFNAEVDAAQRVLEQTQERFDVGLVPITDVNDSQASYDLAVVNRLVEQNTLNQRLEVLESITGQPHDDLETLNPEFPIVAPDQPMEEWVMVAQENNLAIQAAEFSYESSDDSAKAARAALLPTLDIAANYNWNRSSNPFSFFNVGVANERSSVQLNLTIPLFAGGGNRARMREAYYLRDASEEVLLRTQRDAVLAARNTYRSLLTNVQAVQARQQAIISAQSALEATEVGAEVGTRNVVDVVLAQRLLFQAQRDYANSRYDYVMDTLNLREAAGTLTPQDVIDLNEWLVP